MLNCVDKITASYNCLSVCLYCCSQTFFIFPNAVATFALSMPFAASVVYDIHIRQAKRMRGTVVTVKNICQMERERKSKLCGYICTYAEWTSINENVEHSGETICKCTREILRSVCGRAVALWTDGVLNWYMKDTAR